MENLLNSGVMAASEYEVGEYNYPLSEIVTKVFHQVLTAWFDHLVASPEVDLGIDLIVYMR